LWNESGERFWVKWHFKSNQGIQCVSDQEAASLPSHGAQQDLVEAIENGEYPSWAVKVQILTEQEARTFPVNPFDLTKVWPHELAPLIEIGQLTLNRNVENYFAETEQASFAPSNLVPGIGPSPDKMLQARLLAYQDAQRYRVGVNYNFLPVNAPRCPVHHYQRDGAMAGVITEGTGTNQDGEVNFYPNGQSDLPQPDGQFSPPPLPLLEEAWVQSYSQDNEDYYEQAGNLFRIMTDEQRTRLASTIAGGLSHAKDAVQDLMLGYIENADPEYANRVRKALASASA
jgi:catalase